MYQVICDFLRVNRKLFSCLLQIFRSELFGPLIYSGDWQGC